MKAIVYSLFPHRFEKFWDCISTADFAANMPNLREMEIILESAVVSTRSRPQDSTVHRYRKEWPPYAKSAVLPCVTLRRLTLELQVKWINMSLLKSLFPNVTALELRINDSYMTKADPVPFLQVCETWPDLQKLKISGTENILHGNYDADIIGISEEEVEILWRMEEKDLGQLQIVPIRPSLLTMSSKVEKNLQNRTENGL